jgi:magnesium transporter
MNETLDAAPAESAPVRRRLPNFRAADGSVSGKFVEAVSAAIAARDGNLLRRMTRRRHESDIGDLLEALPEDDRPLFVKLMGAHFDFTALTEVDDTVREEILDELPPEAVAEGVRVLDSDDAVRILEDLPKEEQAEILGALPGPERIALEKSLDYPENSAGRRMQTEFVAVAADSTVGDAIDHLRENRDLPDRFYEVYVVDADQRLVGAVPLDRLLRAQRPVEIADIMLREREAVRATEQEEEVARLFERYDLVSAPVVDDNGRLIGVLTVDDIVDVIERAAEADIKALGGVQASEQLSDPVWKIARGRFNWLLVNLATAFLASSVLGLFQAELQQMVALAVLAPIVASQGGNATTQTMTIVVRALATRELGSSNTARLVGRELMVGLVNGLAFAVITGIAAVAWFKTPGLGIVIGLAMLCNLAAAALGGVLVPVTLNRLKFDPAVASGVFITTVTDVVGFFAFLAIATWWFGFA